MQLAELSPPVDNYLELILKYRVARRIQPKTTQAKSAKATELDLLMRDPTFAARAMEKLRTWNYKKSA